MTTHLAHAADDSWLTPRDTYLVLALTDPPPAEVHRDLANILRTAAASADPWRPVSATVTPPEPRPSPDSGNSWFHRALLRPRF
jgi:hypothetical protein